MTERHKDHRVHEPVMHDRICRPGTSNSPKRDAFIDLYLALGDAALAYERAGYKCTSHKSLMTAANRLLNTNYVRAEIERRTIGAGLEHPLHAFGHADPTLPPIATKDERQRFWTSAMRNEGLDMKFRLKASELLAKTQGDYVEQVQIVLVSDIRAQVQSLLGLEIIDITPTGDE